MRSSFFAVCVVFCVSAFVVRHGFCEQPKPAADAGKTAASVDQDAPQPEEVLRQMADYLGGLPAFSCDVQTEIHVQAEGRDNREARTVAVRVERPNKIALVAQLGDSEVAIVSDGQQIVQFFGMVNRYVAGEAPADLAGLAASDECMGLALLGAPSAAVPTNGEAFYTALTSDVTGSEYLGTEKVGDVLCHHCRFLQEGLNWEIWIEVGKRPLVWKVVPDLSQRLAGQGNEIKVEYVVTFADWNVAQQFAAADFQFELPVDAEEVESVMEAIGGREEKPHPNLGQPAPTFETVDPEGAAIDLAAHLGKDVIMLDFWATWCGPCVQAMPEVEGVVKKFADLGLVFYAVNVGEDTVTVKEFLDGNEVKPPVAMDPEGKIAGLYHAEGIPQTVLIGKDGKVQVVHVGFGPNLADVLSSEVEDLLAGKDLASEVLAKAEAAKKKRAARAKKAESAEAEETQGEAESADAAEGE
jgi:peroxiredoxin